jgi:NADP-dependent 3-hydroxy acid dehydrogenase YdfG
MTKLQNPTDSIIDLLKHAPGPGLFLAHQQLIALSNPKHRDSQVGSIEVATYNLGAQIGNVSLEDTSVKKFELGWRLGCEGLFRLAKATAPYMVERATGCLLVTSATAAVRGNRGQHSHAAAMGGRRMLCQTLGHELGPQGIHVCHFIIDGAVNAPDTLGRMLGAEQFARLQAQGDAILQPAHIAETFFHIASQPRSAWTNEMDLRPFSEDPWWTSASSMPPVRSA